MDRFPGQAQEESSSTTSMFLCGDVMTGRGIDQILGHPSDPVLYERSVRDARAYIELAERKSGPIPRRVSPDYIWGEALNDLDRVDPDLRIINLETSVTTSDAYWVDKGIHYRMHPRNIDCLTAASIDCCILANNHVLDWGYDGLEETIQTVRRAGLQTAGAGRDLKEARMPAAFNLGHGSRSLLFAVGSPSSGVPARWSATANRAGIWMVDEGSPGAIAEIGRIMGQYRRPGDLIVLSIHWGPNWGYEIPSQQRDFAHQAIDVAGVDLVYGHSSHHVKGLEVYNEKLILYGCGDFLNDYEGIAGYERYRDELGLMYFLTLAVESGDVDRIKLMPTMIQQFKVNRPSRSDAARLAEVVKRESGRLGTALSQSGDREILFQEQPA